VEAVMGTEEIAAITLRYGAKYPYDAPDEWWNGDGSSPPPATDWAHSAARGILADLNDRRGIKHGFANLDEGIRAEIVASLAEIIRQAAKEPRP
jgi:hypothetical protein